MSKWLRLPVIAEGVETKVQAEYLKSIGCVYMQGYYFAKPMPVDAFEEILTKSDTESADSRQKFYEDTNNAGRCPIT